jgi:hypothetical protein
MLEWIADNKEWIFSGIGVTVLGTICSWAIRKKHCRSTGQTQRGSGNSRNVQVGRDINLYAVPSPEDEQREADLRVVDVRVIDDINDIETFREHELGQEQEKILNSGTFPILDIKLRNAGKATVFVKSLQLDVKLVRAVLDRSDYRAYPVSWEYTALLNPHQKTACVVVNLSQKIPPNDIDRFALAIGHTMDYGELEYADYTLDMTLHYNEDQRIALGKHKVRVHAPACFSPKRKIAPWRLPASE